MSPLKDEDDFTHYFNATARLTKENAELPREIERLRTGNLVAADTLRSYEREVERLKAVINEYEKQRLSRLGGIGSPA